MCLLYELLWLPLRRCQVYPSWTAASLLQKSLLIDSQARWFLVVGWLFYRVFSDADLIGRQRARTAPATTPATGAALASSTIKLFRAILILSMMVLDVCSDLPRVLIGSSVVLFTVDLGQSAILLLLERFGVIWIIDVVERCSRSVSSIKRIET